MHYYDRQGNPCHTVIGRNGNERSTSIIDARKLLLAPSVTTVLSELNKDWLAPYIRKQVLNAVMAHPFQGDETTWRKRISGVSDEHRRKAADKGSDIHNSMEKYFLSHELDHNRDYVTPAVQLIHSVFPGAFWSAEKSFAAMEGFGGSVDLHGRWENHWIVIDFKTKDREDIFKVTQDHENKMQLAAYQLGLRLNGARRYNLFINTNEEQKGACSLLECKQYDKYKQMFLHLLNYWKIKNDYESGWE